MLTPTRSLRYSAHISGQEKCLDWCHVATYGGLRRKCLNPENCGDHCHLPEIPDYLYFPFLFLTFVDFLPLLINSLYVKRTRCFFYSTIYCPKKKRRLPWNTHLSYIFVASWHNGFRLNLCSNLYLSVLCHKFYTNGRFWHAAVLQEVSELRQRVGYCFVSTQRPDKEDMLFLSIRCMIEFILVACYCAAIIDICDFLRISFS